MGLYSFDNPYERIIFQTVEAERSSHTESIWLKYLFSQTSFMLVKPRINSERSRCLLVVFSASLENVLVNNLVVCEKSEHKPVQPSFFRLVYLEINPILLVNPVNKSGLSTALSSLITE